MKASEIMFDASLPHGTKEGFEAGCRGSHCMGVETLGQSCKQASIRYASDYSYRRRIDNGLSPEAIAAEDVLEAESVPAAKSEGVVFTDHHGNVNVVTPSITVEDSREPVTEKPERKKPGRPAGPLVHGTANGYKRGCRDDCPRGENGLTCRQAASGKKPAAAAVEAPVVRAEGLLSDLADAKAEVERLTEELAGRDVTIALLSQDKSALKAGKSVFEGRSIFEIKSPPVAQVQTLREMTVVGAGLEVRQQGGVTTVEMHRAEKFTRLDLSFDGGVLVHASAEVAS